MLAVAEDVEEPHRDGTVVAVVGPALYTTGGSGAVFGEPPVLLDGE